MRFLITSLVLAAAGTTFAADPVTHFRDHLGLQLYSLRAQFKVKDSAASTLDQLKAWQVTEVETAGTAGLPPEKFLELLRERGLKPVAAHLGWDRLTKDLAGAISEARTLGVTYALCPVIPHKDGFNDEAARQAAAKFNEWGAAFKAAGIQFGYHTHGFEFSPSAAGGDDRVFDVLVRATDPKLVQFEMDVLWVYNAGIDPVKLLEKYPDRWTLLHVKDLRKGAPRGAASADVPPADRVAVGTGQIDTAAVLRTAEKIGVKHYFIEDEGVAPLKDIPASLAYLRQLKF